MKEEQQWDSELGRLKEVLKNRSQEAEEWKTRAIRMESELSKTKDLTFYNNELTGKVEMNNRDIERLNAALKDKNRELDESKRKLTAKEAEDGSLKKS